MTLFMLSLLPLLLGPLFVQGLQRVPAMIPALDGFVLVSVGGIALLGVLPDAVSHGGWMALVAATAGLLLPLLLERKSGQGQPRSRPAWVLLAVAGLAIHGMLDGVALAAGELAARQGPLLALGVLIHRVPSGVAIWWLARRRLGLRGAIFSVTTLAAASALGFAASHQWHGIFHGAFWHVAQALLFGTLLHVLMHAPLDSGSGRWATHSRLATAMGATAGAALLVTLERLGVHAEHGLVGHAKEAAPYAILVLALAVLIFQLVRRWRGSSSNKQL